MFHIDNAPIKKDSKKSIKIFLRLHNGNGCQIVSNPCSKLADILQHEKLKSLDLPKSFRLVSQGKQISNYNLTLKELGLTDNSIIHIETKQILTKRQIMIDVAIFYNNDKFYVRVNTSETIQQLKNKLSRVIKILPKNQHLYFKGQILQNDRRIESYKIKNDSLICLQTQNLKQQPKIAEIPGCQSQKYLPFGNNSMMYHNILDSFSGSAQIGRSLNQTQGMQHLGFQVEIRQKDQDDSTLMSSHNFNFKDFCKLSSESKETNEQPRSRKNKEEAVNDLISDQEGQCCNNLSFSDRLMII